MSKKKKIIIITICSVLATLLLASVLVVFVYVIPEYKKKQEWLEAVEAHRNAKYATYETENAQYASGEVDVAFLGDSLTDGYDVDNYYPQFKVENRGIGGDTTFDLEKRLKVSVYDLQPKVVVMLIGANNFKTMFDNYENIVKGLTTNLPNSKIVLLSLTAMNGEIWGINNELACFNNVKIELIAKKYGCTFIDLFTPLFDLESNGIKLQYTTDGGHLTPAGYDVITGVITPVLEQLL